MFNRNDGAGHINILQNQFTAYLSIALRRNKMQYIRKKDRVVQQELPLEDFDYELSDSQTPLHNLIYAVDGEILHIALKKIKKRERYILLARVIDEKSLQRLPMNWECSTKQWPLPTTGSS